MLDNESRSDTIPDIIIENDDIDLGHEARSAAFRMKIFTTS